MHASVRGHVDVARLRLEASAEVNLADQDAWTALMWASATGHVDTARILLEAGVENLADKEGWTALVWASISGHCDVVRLLLKEQGVAKQQRQLALTMAEARSNVRVERCQVGVHRPEIPIKQLDKRLLSFFWIFAALARAGSLG